MKQYARFRAKANEPFDSSEQVDGSDHNAEEIIQAAAPAMDKTYIHYYFVPPKRQHDPNTSEILTSQATLERSYHRLSHGTCIIAPRNKPAFCKFTVMAFSTMSAEELQGWEKLVCFFLDQTNYVQKVKNNGPHMGGEMWACGWRKCSKRQEGFGQYCCVARLTAMMKKSLYNAEDEADAFREANEWIAIQLIKLAPNDFDQYHQALTEKNLPSMAHMEYPTPYSIFDFASFFTFTMHNFFNAPHKDTDVNNWTLVCWIPIFNPNTSDEDTPILADKQFDMVGGQFTFRDFQVYLDLNEVVGVTMCVFRSNKEVHQTLDGESKSGKYTRVGFSCQMSEKMSNAVIAYINQTTEKKQPTAGQTARIQNAEKKLMKA